MTATARVKTLLADLDLRGPRCENVADRMGVTPGVIRRALTLENTTFSELLIEERIRRGAELARLDPHLGAARMADALGYSSPDGLYRMWPEYFGVGFWLYCKRIRAGA